MKRNLIRIKSILILFVLSNVAFAQQVSVEGSVLDSISQLPLSGVSISVKGGEIDAATDNNGSFKLNVQFPTTLIFKSIGYSEKEVTVQNQKFIDVELSPEVATLDEVVVVGYGTQKKINVTGSVASIGGEKLASRPITNISAALQGELPGVSVIQRSGQPGKDNGIIRVRGVGTMNNSSPMVVVDGIEASMEDLNPNDIESISVLKDASAGAIYGSRALTV